MNHPTAADFFAQQHDDDEAYDAAADAGLDPNQGWAAQPDTLWQMSPDPLEKIAEGVQQLVEHFTTGQTFTAELASTDDSAYAALKENHHVLCEELDDLEAKYVTVLQVIAEVDAALGKSTAKPSLAARAAIERWRNPQIEVTAEPGEEFPAIPAELLPGHTRTQTDQGADFCQECSEKAQEWVQWPCPDVDQAFNPQPVVVEAEPVTQPAHDAPVEEWRTYATAQGLAGPDIAKANRSQIRTALGIAQPAPKAGA